MSEFVLSEEEEAPAVVEIVAEEGQVKPKPPKKIYVNVTQERLDRTPVSLHLGLEKGSYSAVVKYVARFIGPNKVTWYSEADALEILSNIDHGQLVAISENVKSLADEVAVPKP